MELSLTIQYDCYILYDLYRVVPLIFTMLAFYIVFFDFNAFNSISMSYIYIMMFRLNECNIFLFYYNVLHVKLFNKI